MRRWLAVVLMVGSFASACGGDPGRVRVVVSQGAQRVVVRAEIAATPAQRTAGLMNRATVPAGTGMLFVFPSATSGGFWMKNTLVDLQIVFIDGDRVIEIRTMRPCTEDPCPLTTPAAPYDMALEVPAGTMGSIGVGARVEVDGTLPDPT